MYNTSWAAPASASRCVFLRYTRKLLYIFLPSTAAEEEEAAPQEAAPHVAIATPLNPCSEPLLLR